MFWRCIRRPDRLWVSSPIGVTGEIPRYSYGTECYLAAFSLPLICTRSKQNYRVQKNRRSAFRTLCTSILEGHELTSTPPAAPRRRAGEPEGGQSSVRPPARARTEVVDLGICGALSNPSRSLIAATRVTGVVASPSQGNGRRPVKHARKKRREEKKI